VCLDPNPIFSLSLLECGPLQSPTLLNCYPRLEEEGTGSEGSKEFPPNGSLEEEVEKSDLEAVAMLPSKLRGGSMCVKSGEDKQASSLDALATEGSNELEQGNDANLAETDQIGNQIEAVYDENEDDQIGGDNHARTFLFTGG
jgi:hypothetical protein